MSQLNKYYIHIILNIIHNYKNISKKQNELLNSLSKLDYINKTILKKYHKEIKKIYNKLIFLYNQIKLYTYPNINLDNIQIHLQICNKQQIELYTRYNLIFNSYSQKYTINEIKLQKLYDKQLISPIVTEQLLLQTAFPKLAEINNIYKY